MKEQQYEDEENSSSDHESNDLNDELQATPL